MIPIRKEGMAVCEKCGAIGVKHSFYTKERRFCSQACAKSFNESPHMSSNNSEKRLNLQPGQQPVNRKLGQPAEDVHVYSNKKRLLLAKEVPGSDKDKYGFDWVEMLTEPGFVTPPISCFRHAPLCDTWASDVSVGMKVEVENTDTRQATANSDPQSYWVASVISLMGYKALLRYEGFGNDDSKDFWVNLAAEDVHPVGWCASKGKPLIPPRTIQDKYTEWREFLVKRLTGARSLPNQFHVRVLEACRSRFRLGMTVELIDRNRLSSVKVAVIDMIVGRRLLLRYEGSVPDEMGFWCHEESSLIHPVGWSQAVGHHIDALPAYLERCAKKVFLHNDASSELFNEMKPTQGNGALKFKEGMKLEAVDPLNLDHICVASVVKVLRQGYLMIRIDRQEADAGDDQVEDPGEFCYHSSSACIAPPGFCEANAITLKPPEDYEGRFRWGDYLRQNKATPAPESLFGGRDENMPQLRVGMRVEAADLMDPRLVCVATIAQIAGRLVRIHFDGWSDDFDQWMDISSPEIYPVGWCELAGYRLETPIAPVVVAPVVKKGRKPGRGGRGKSRGGARGGGRSQNISTSTAAPNAVVNKRERSPSADSSKAVVRGKTAKLIPLPTKKSQESPRSLRSRGGQNQNCPSPADEAPTAIQNLHQRSTRRRTEPDDAEMSNSSFASPNRSMPPTSATVPKAESHSTGESNDYNGKRIPRLIDISAALRREALSGVSPLEWTTQDVAQFLRVNDYTAYCDTFTNASVDGRGLLSMSKDQVLQLTNMKLGPSLKIFDLVSQLKSKVGPGSRQQNASN
ncbi:polycomb protein Sfmbt-like isoform X3 [Daphnia pulicaria]|nr:polycomb protein Sfmbt-like isoform X3 [Daphnia pulicaria]XP_046634888.1 polycomb protein Sfmbt-like isoform X3 [Daphnia pulicaria]